MAVRDEIGPARTAFVFAGGGSFGAIQVGMLQSLAAHGVAADMVVGSSVGALNGAFYAGDPTLDGVQRLAAVWRGLTRRYMEAQAQPQRRTAMSRPACCALTGRSYVIRACPLCGMSAGTTSTA